MRKAHCSMGDNPQPSPASPCVLRTKSLRSALHSAPARSTYASKRRCSPRSCASRPCFQAPHASCRVASRSCRMRLPSAAMSAWLPIPAAPPRSASPRARPRLPRPSLRARDSPAPPKSYEMPIPAPTEKRPRCCSDARSGLGAQWATSVTWQALIRAQRRMRSRLTPCWRCCGLKETTGRASDSPSAQCRRRKRRSGKLWRQCNRSTLGTCLPAWCSTDHPRRYSRSTD